MDTKKIVSTNDRKDKLEELDDSEKSSNKTNIDDYIYELAEYDVENWQTIDQDHYEKFKSLLNKDGYESSLELFDKYLNIVDNIRASKMEIDEFFDEVVTAQLEKGFISEDTIEDRIRETFPEAIGDNTYFDITDYSITIHDLVQPIDIDELFKVIDSISQEALEEYGDPFFDPVDELTSDLIIDCCFIQGLGLSEFQINNNSDLFYTAAFFVKDGVLKLKDELSHSLIYRIAGNYYTTKILMSETLDEIKNILIKLGQDYFGHTSIKEAIDSCEAALHYVNDNSDKEGLSALIEVLTLADPALTGAEEEDVELEEEVSNMIDLSLEIPLTKENIFNEDVIKTFTEDYELPTYYCVSDGLNPKNAKIFVGTEEGKDYALRLAQANPKYKYVSRFENGNETIIWKRED